jgi:hypothetical protein
MTMASIATMQSAAAIRNRTGRRAMAMPIEGDGRPVKL